MKIEPASPILLPTETYLDLGVDGRGGICDSGEEEEEWEEEQRPIWKYSARDKIPPLIGPNTHEPFKESLSDNYIELREPNYKYTPEGVCKCQCNVPLLLTSIPSHLWYCSHHHL